MAVTHLCVFPGAAGSCTAQPLLCPLRPVLHGKGKAGKSHGQGKPLPARCAQQRGGWFRSHFFRWEGWWGWGAAPLPAGCHGWVSCCCSAALGVGFHHLIGHLSLNTPVPNHHLWCQIWWKSSKHNPHCNFKVCCTLLWRRRRRLFGLFKANT